MTGHPHKCDWCGAVYTCHAPLVTNVAGLPEQVCIIVFENSECICPQCWDEWDEREEREAEYGCY